MHVVFFGERHVFLKYVHEVLVGPLPAAFMTVDWNRAPWL
jgi:hypothetical protein